MPWWKVSIQGAAPSYMSLGSTAMAALSPRSSSRAGTETGGAPLTLFPALPPRPRLLLTRQCSKPRPWPPRRDLSCSPVSGASLPLSPAAWPTAASLCRLRSRPNAEAATSTARSFKRGGTCSSETAARLTALCLPWHCAEGASPLLEKRLPVLPRPREQSRMAG